jgi:tRNA(Ile)-lysidine synthase
MVLLDRLLREGRDAVRDRLTLVHCNYQVRDAADADEDFVRAIAAQHHLPLIVVRPGPKPARHNFQAWAREIRYAHLRDIATTQGAASVMVGHQADDQAETVLWHLLRGSGLRGLAGMEMSSALTDALTLRRPLLRYHRADILAYARGMAVPYVEDATNADDTYQRGRIRHTLLPQCETLVSRATQHIARTAGHLREDLECLDTLAEEAWAQMAPTIAAQRVAWPRAAHQALPDALRHRIVRLAYRALVGPGTSPLVRDHLCRVNHVMGAGRGSYRLPQRVQFTCDGPSAILARGDCTSSEAMLR